MSLQKLPPSLPPENVQAHSASTTALPQKSYSRRLYELALADTRRHPKKNMIASTVVASVLALFAGWSAGGILLGIGAAMLAALGTLIVIFIINLLLAPRALDRALRDELSVWKQQAPDLNTELIGMFLGPPVSPFEKSVQKEKSFLTAILFVVNTRSENNCIKQYGLEVDVDGQKHKGEVVATSRLLLASAMREFVDLDELRRSVLEQGQPKEAWSRFCFDGSIDIKDKPFVFTVTDVYNFRYVIEGRTPSTFSDDIVMKNLTPPEAYMGI